MSDDTGKGAQDPRREIDLGAAERWQRLKRFCFEYREAGMWLDLSCMRLAEEDRG